MWWLWIPGWRALSISRCAPPSRAVGPEARSSPRRPDSDARRCIDETATVADRGAHRGATAGASDALVAIIRGVGGLGPEKAVRLVIVGASLLALLGLIAGSLIVCAARIPERIRRVTGRLVFFQMLAALVSAPLLIYDAAAMFSGRKADAIPAHGLIPSTLAVLGLVAIYLLVGWYRQLLEKTGSRT